MRNRIVVALLLSMIAAPTFAADAAGWYWDRYAVASSNEPVPADSATSPAYRNQYAVMSHEQARAAASARAHATGGDRARHDASTAAQKDAACGCTCCEQDS